MSSNSGQSNHNYDTKQLYKIKNEQSDSDVLDNVQVYYGWLLWLGFDDEQIDLAFVAAN